MSLENTCRHIRIPLRRQKQTIVAWVGKKSTWNAHPQSHQIAFNTNSNETSSNFSPLEDCHKIEYRFYFPSMTNEPFLRRIRGSLAKPGPESVPLPLVSWCYPFLKKSNNHKTQRKRLETIASSCGEEVQESKNSLF